MTAQKNKKKILYVASTESHLRRFHMPYIEALRACAEVHLMAKGDRGAIDFDVPFEKSMLSLSNFRTILKIRKILRENRYDAVILNTSLAAFLVRAAMLFTRRRPFVHNIVHGYLFNEPVRSKKDRVLHLCERILRRKTDMISVMNAHDLEIAKRNKFCRGDVAFLYGMGVDMPTERPTPDPALRAQYAADGALLCTFVGELSTRKNQSFLIRAFDRLKRQGLPVRLMLVGEGGEREALEAEIASRGLDGTVWLLGNREPVLPYLGITDLYVSASRIEGLPFNIMEAMACGLPILASDAKGQTDLLSESDGALYREGDMDAFCAAMERFYKDGARGVGTCDYPILDRYRLDAVFEENLALMKKGWC